MRSGVLWAVLSIGFVVSCVGPVSAEDKEKAGGHGKSKMHDLFTRLDKNHDGKLSEAELQVLHKEILGAKDATDFEHFEKEMKSLATEEPQIDLFKGWLDLSVYTIVVFLLLFSVLYFFAWKPIAEGLGKRERSIAEDRRAADDARKEATQMRGQLDAEKARANDEVRRMMDKARADAEAVANEREAQGKAALAADRERMKREVEVAYAQAKQDVMNQGAKLATLLSAKVIRKNLTEADHQSLIDEALAEFRSAASNRKHDIESATA